MTDNKEKVSGLHKDITYTTRENGEVSGLRFHSDEGRKKFAQMQMLQVLKAEAINTMGLRFYRGSIINRLRRYFPEIPRTKKKAYKYLVDRGYYDWDRDVLKERGIDPKDTILPNKEDDAISSN